MSESPIQLSVRQLLAEDSYLIPMYQRNFAWEEGEIRQLIRDVIDSLQERRPYYMGSLVVSERDSRGPRVFEIIDGQQRVTTLALLACYLKNDLKTETSGEMSWYNRLGIRFQAREHSTTTLGAIFDGILMNGEPRSLLGMVINGGLLTGYRLIQQCLKAELKESGVALPDFVEFLLNHVFLVRVKVPADTDLNHYFEILNNRGEQLEKHELLKSRLMETLDRNSPPEERQANQRCIHEIWTACSDMERYMLTKFEKSKRNAVFENMDRGGIIPKNFDSLRNCLESASSKRNGGGDGLTLDEIICGPSPKPEGGEDKSETSERFTTVVNFPNFLLHVLRVTTGENVALDDKRLISEFEKFVITSSNSGEKVKQFVFGLLYCRFLFDQYVLKREYFGKKDRWSLKRCKWQVTDNDKDSINYVNSFNAEGEEESDVGINRKILMLLSAFHVSSPAMDRKYWLNAALNHLFQESEIKGDVYLKYLESVAKAFVFDRYLSVGEGAEYFEIIQNRKGQCQTIPGSVSFENFASKLSFVQIENNFVFNYLDYLLWLKLRKKRSSIKYWEFSFRSSVEHFYPKTPMEGLPELQPGILHSFGNLCLISHSKNSRLSNFTPKAKRDLYPNDSFDSIKQRLMMDEPVWNAEAIQRHQKDMIECLVETSPKE